MEKVIEGAELLQRNLSGRAARLGLEEFDLKVKLATRYLIRSFIKELDEEQKKRVECLVRKRLINEIGREMFSKALDAPIKEGGVGLDKRLVKKVVQELEVILLVKFGIEK